MDLGIMIFNRPEPKKLYNQIRDLFSVYVLGGAPIIPESNEFYVVNNDYASAETIYSNIQRTLKELDWETACCSNLYKAASDLGIYPRPKMRHRGFVKIMGVNSTNIPLGTKFNIGQNVFEIDQQLSGNIYNIENGVVYIGVKNTVDELLGDVPSITNLQTPIVGVTEVKLLGYLCGGDTEENCEEFRKRAIQRRKTAYKPNIKWVVEKLEEFPCVTRVAIRECDECLYDGNTNVYVFFDNTFEYGIPPLNVVRQIDKWFYGKVKGAGQGQAPIGMFGSVYVPEVKKVDIQIISADCLSNNEINSFKTKLQELFSNFNPGDKLPKLWINVLLLNVNPNLTSYTVKILVDGVEHNEWCNHDEDLNVECDELIVLGEVTIK
jgi:uncharacterized phage protein gp47/JayE